MAPLLLGKLPFLPLKDAVDLMDAQEKFNLAISSKKMKQTVQAMKFKVFGFHLRINKIACHVSLYESDDVRHRAPDVAFYKKDEDMKSDEPMNCGAELHVVSNPLEECLNLVRQYRSIFKVGYQAFLVDLQDDQKETKELMAMILAEGCDSLDLYDTDRENPKMVDISVLNCLMDNLKLEARLNISGLIPSDFKHKKALKFARIHYSHSEWISLNDVKSIRNRRHFSIGRTIFDTSDMNQLLHYWVNCEEDMMEYFCIAVKEGDQIVEEQLFEGLLTVPIIERQTEMRLIKSDSPKKRQFILGRVFCRDKREVILEAFKSDGEYELYLSVFDDLQKERDLKKELVEIEQDLRKDQKSIDEILKRKAGIVK